MVSLAELDEVSQARCSSSPGTLEILIGQLLGPNPGQGGQERGTDGRIVPYPHADIAGLYAAAEEFRQYCGWRDEASKQRPSSGWRLLSARAG